MVRILDTYAVTACGIKIEEYQVELDEAALRQTGGLDEKLSRIYDKHASLPEPKEANNAFGDAVPARTAPEHAIDRKRGPKRKKGAAAEEAMLLVKLEELDALQEKHLVERWGHLGGRTTLADARRRVLPKLRQIPGNDK